MNSELEVLKKVWENNEQSSIKSISRQTGFGVDYTRYICSCLFAKGEIAQIKSKRNWYKITSQGKKELERQGVIKPKVSKKESQTEKIVWYLPKSSKTAKNNSKKIGLYNRRNSLIKSEEKQLNLGRSIEKAVSFLKRSLTKG